MLLTSRWQRFLEIRSESLSVNYCHVCLLANMNSTSKVTRFNSFIYTCMHYIGDYSILFSTTEHNVNKSLYFGLLVQTRIVGFVKKHEKQCSSAKQQRHGQIGSGPRVRKG